MSDQPDEEQQDEHDSEEGEDEEVNDPLTQSDADAPHAPWGSRPDSDE